MEEEKNELNWHRVVLSCLLALIGFEGVVIFFFSHFVCHKEMFIVDESRLTGLGYFFRFLWCLFFAFIGLSVIAFYWRNEKESPWIKYITFYLPEIFAIAGLVFGILHLWQKANGYVFYYFSGSLSYIMGVMVDDFFKLVAAIIGVKKQSQQSNNSA